MISANFFDAIIAECTLKPAIKIDYHRDYTMSKAEIMLIMYFPMSRDTAV